ncbi:hypothetical protein GF339_19100 [candidate division KSB3 bacterium]|uniref:Uncharacterized protein n=1 Tax=candidate division KSB3 bacterium TaxID=2044937 RepID=A0A9D5Q7B5_9BACT|nr:hypothetical protein [candidate division KSB3 bacterium]MBD3326700.1 hypothetical protein [candidate division KSB3 bacterium]
MLAGLSDEYRILFEGGFAIADECLTRAIRSIDLRFGQGYAKAHPELVTTYMTIAAQEFNTSSSQKRQREVIQGTVSRLSALIDDVLQRLTEKDNAEKR